MAVVEILLDGILDAIVQGEGPDKEQEIYVSLNTMLGVYHPKAIKMRALVNNKVMLMLLDLGSSYSFVDEALAQKM